MRTMKELLEAAEGAKVSLGEISLRWQAEKNRESLAAVRDKMGERLQIMRLSVQDGCSPELRSASGRVGGQASKMVQADQMSRFGVVSKACAYAMAVAESNACMGKIVAAPTAGSCGILPGALLAVQEEEHF